VQQSKLLPYSAAFVSHGGSGALLPDEPSPDAVRDAVRELVDDDRVRDTVRSHRPSIEAMPAPEEVVPVLEAFASGGTVAGSRGAR